MRATERRWIRACTRAHGRPSAMTTTAAQPTTKMAWKARVARVLDAERG